MDLIIPHMNADFDALASALAATKLYPNAQVFFPGSQEHNVRDFLEQYPDLLPVIRARRLKREGLRHVILVDVSTPDRLGEFEWLLTAPNVRVIRYDHHGFGQLPSAAVVEQEVVRHYGANVTLMIEELQRQKIPVTAFEATVMALGIYEETGNLTYTSTTAEDLEAAAFLRKHGADLLLVAEFVRRRLDGRQQALLQDLLRSRETLLIRGLEISLAFAEVEEFTESLAVLANRLREVENLPVLFVFCRMGSRTYLVARSRVPEVDAGEAARRLGGGGHPTAGSAMFRETDLAGLRGRLLAVLDSMVVPVKTAADFMSAPVATIAPEDTVADAGRIMAQGGYSGLPVMAQGSLAGIITRHDLEKALNHGFAHTAVRHYMSTRVITAQPQDPITQVQHSMVAHAISHMPVMEGGRLVGFLTRADLMRSLLEKKSAAVYPPAWDFSDLQQEPAHLHKLMREHLPEKILSLLHAAGEAADAARVKAYAVGGFVRDILLHVENWDLDIVVEGDGIAYARLLAQTLGGQLRASHPRFGTALLVLPGHLKIDIATARTETYARPGALPQVEAAAIRHDLQRRDFTINAMAVQINPEDFGRLVDDFGGRRDLQEGLIRVLHSVSFMDDPTRIFRAVRFEQRYSFRIEPDTERYLRNALTMDLMSRLSFPRIFDELRLILGEEQPRKALERLGDFGVLSWIHPSLADARQATRYFNAIWESFAFALLFLEEPVDRPLVYLMGLLDGLTPAETEAMSRQYQFPRRITEALLLQKSQGDAALAQFNAVPESTPFPASAIRARLAQLPTEVLLFAMAKADGLPGRRRIRDYITRWRRVRPLLTGKDLRRLHIPPGPVYARIRQALLDARLDGALVSRQDEVDFVEKHFKKN